MGSGIYRTWHLIKHMYLFQDRLNNSLDSKTHEASSLS